MRDIYSIPLYIALGLVSPAKYQTDQEFMQFVVESVGEATGISADKILDHRRHCDVADARSIAMTIIRSERPAISLKRIGNFFGGRDHSTVIHAITKHKSLYNREEDYTEKYNRSRTLYKLYSSNTTLKEVAL